MVKFEKLIILGFGSFIEEVEFRLDQPGINIIRGKTGAGKSTVLSSFYWCLFGDKLKEKSSIQTWEGKRTKEYKGTKVEVHFSIGHEGYRLIRCEGYKGKVDNKKGGNSITLYTNDYPEAKDLGKGKKNQQENLEKLIGYSPELFKSAVIFGQKLKRIIEESGPKKNQIFEEAFSMDYIQEALDIVKIKKEKEKNALRDMLNLFDITKQKLFSNQELYKSAKEFEDYFQDNKNKVLLRISKEMEALKIEQSEYDITEEVDGKSQIHLEDFLSDVKKKIKSVESKIQLNEYKIKDLKKSISKLGDNVCSECGTVLKKSDSKDKIKKIESEVKKRKKKNKKHENHLKELNGSRKEYENSLQDLQDNLDNREDYDKLVTRIKKNKQEFLEEQERKLENKKSPELKNKISELKKQKKDYKKAILSLEKGLEITEWLIKDPLSNTGIKSFLISELIQGINDILHEYADILSFYITFDIDLESSRKEFRQTIRLGDGEIVDYYDLSGGQRQLVDTSIALAIHESIFNIKPTNIMFLDEPFESLDTDTVDIVSELITRKNSEDLSIFIVTHQKSFNPRNANNIRIELTEKGQSKII